MEMNYSDEDSSEGNGYQLESLSSVEDGLVANRRKRGVKRAGAKISDQVLAEDDDEVHESDWELASDEAQQQYDIIDSDFDDSESESDDAIGKQRTDKKVALKRQKDLLDTIRAALHASGQNKMNTKTFEDSSGVDLLDDPLQHSSNPLVRTHYVVSDFGMNTEDQKLEYPGWASTVLSANDARRTVALRKRNCQASMLKAYKLRAEHNDAEAERKREALDVSHHLRGLKERKDVDINKSCVQKGSFEAWISWDGSKGIEWEETTAEDRGEVPPSQRQGGNSYNRELMLYLDLAGMASGRRLATEIPPLPPYFDAVRRQKAYLNCKSAL